jgi:hypothetical protein
MDRALKICVDEIRRVAVEARQDTGFGRSLDEQVELTVQAFEITQMADVPMDECNSLFFERGQIHLRPATPEIIESHDLSLGHRAFEKSGQTRSHEACSAGDQNTHEGLSPFLLE